MKLQQKINGLKVSCATISLAIGAHQSQAQSIDYASFEDLFGEPITVGATGTPKRASEVPVNMTIISADAIKRSGARDIPEILRGQAGLDVSRITQTGSTVAIRGFNVDGGRMRVLINGRDTFRTYEGVTQWASLPVNIEEIRQIEIVRGPSTALYGANAVTGVVNIITYDPIADRVNNLTTRIGDNGLREYTGIATLQFGEGTGGIRLAANHFRADIFDAPLTADDLLIRGTPKDTRLSLDGRFQITDSVQWGIEGTYFEGAVASQGYSGETNNSSAEDYSIKTSLSADTSSGRWSLTAHRNKNKETRIQLVTLETGRIPLDSDIEATSTFIELSNFQAIGTKAAVRFSAGYKNDKVGQFGLSGLAGSGDIGQKTLYASALIDYAFTDSLSVAASARYDHMNISRDATEVDWLPFTNEDYGSFSEISVNLGLVYKASDTDTVKLTYGRGFNAPNLFDFGGQIIDSGPGTTFPGIRGFGGGPTARPSIVQQFELQYTKKIEAIDGALNTAVFYRLDSDFFRSLAAGRLHQTPSGFFYSGYGVIGDMDTYGFEVDLSGNTAAGLNWALRYSYSTSNGDRANDPTVGPITGSLYPFVEEYFDDRSSDHIASASLGYNSGNFWVDTLIQYKSGYRSNAGNIFIPGLIDPFRDVDNVWVGNLTVGYQFDNGLAFLARGENLFNKLQEQIVTPSNAVERRIWVSLSYDF